MEETIIYSWCNPQQRIIHVLWEIQLNFDYIYIYIYIYIYSTRELMHRLIVTKTLHSSYSGYSLGNPVASIYVPKSR